MNSGILKFSSARSFFFTYTRRMLSTKLEESNNKVEQQTEKICPGEKMQKLAEKIRQKTPIGKLDELEEGKHPYQEKEPLPSFPGGINPSTGEKGGPRGPEPTRYGDWERKGRVTDF